MSRYCIWLVSYFFSMCDVMNYRACHIAKSFLIHWLLHWSPSWTFRMQNLYFTLWIIYDQINGICTKTFDNMIHPSDAYSGIHDKYGRYISDMVENFLWIFFITKSMLFVVQENIRKNIIQRKHFCNIADWFIVFNKLGYDI